MSAASIVRASVCSSPVLLLSCSPVVGGRCFEEPQVGEPPRFRDLPEEQRCQGSELVDFRNLRAHPRCFSVAFGLLDDPEDPRPASLRLRTVAHAAHCCPTEEPRRVLPGQPASVEIEMASEAEPLGLLQEVGSALRTTLAGNIQTAPRRELQLGSDVSREQLSDLLACGLGDEVEVSVEETPSVGFDRQIELGTVSSTAKVMLQQLSEAIGGLGILELRKREEPSAASAEHIAQRLDAFLNCPLLTDGTSASRGVARHHFGAVLAGALVHGVAHQVID